MPEDNESRRSAASATSLVYPPPSIPTDDHLLLQLSARLLRSRSRSINIFSCFSLCLLFNSSDIAAAASIAVAVTLFLLLIMPAFFFAVSSISSLLLLFLYLMPHALQSDYRKTSVHLTKLTRIEIL
ncbi:hypothetical protein HPP92_008020 [Vanilla planifolia]|uniref:Uncharacterized protein n=1 Tax=Vanilla planifolia TaxID=51239 RepID=A0A835RSC1_VANPL|nr:hypothetical protein HPP92_008020 [Vanilla planifolia]